MTDTANITNSQSKGVLWLYNPNAWPVSSLVLGGQTYTKAELLALLRPASKSDATLILANQLIGAKLNIANRADGTPVSATINNADAVFSLYSGKLPYQSKRIRQTVGG